MPPALRADLDAAAGAASSAVAGLRGWLADEYLPQADGTPDGVGDERYLTSARYWIWDGVHPAVPPRLTTIRAGRPLAG